jgi:hypothetical protein
VLRPGWPDALAGFRAVCFVTAIFLLWFAVVSGFVAPLEDRGAAWAP